MTCRRPTETGKPRKSEEYHSVRNIADRWDTSERHVRRLIKRGDLVAHRFGAVVRVSRADLLACERARREG